MAATRFQRSAAGITDVGSKYFEGEGTRRTRRSGEAIQIAAERGK